MSLNEKINQVIIDTNNPLDQSDKNLIKQLYNNISQLVKHSLDGHTPDDLGFEFWLEILTSVMILVEKFIISGEKKKFLVIETICLVIQREVPLDEDVKEAIIKNFRRIAPSIINVVVSAASHINIDPEKVGNCITKYLCCCCSK